MKKNQLRKLLYFMSVLMLAAMVMVSCKDDDDDDDPILVEDGFYIKGAVTPFADLDFKGILAAGQNEVGQVMRPGMFEKYVALQAGATGFNIVQVAGQTTTTWGPATVESVSTDGLNEQPNITIQKGTLGNTGVFTVPTDGLYHVIIDTQTGVFVIAPVPYWAILGGSTALGWSDSQMPLVGAFSMTAMTFKIENLELRAGNFKFRYGGGWKLEINGDTIKINTNFGGVVSGTLPNLTTTLVPGGPDYLFDAANEGVYTVTLDWTVADGFKSTLTKTGDVEPLPEYPEAMFLVGDATAYGWDAPGNTDEALMHKAAGGVPTEGLFWKIAHLEAGLGFKLAAENWGNPNLGFADVNEFDIDGIVVTEAGGNMSIATSGMYMIVLDLRNEMIKVSIKEAAVYGIGDAFGGWDAGVEANKFIVDNTAKTLTSPALVANGNIRMYASHAWIPDWWNAEFNVFTGKIEYRNDGGDQAAVAGTTGQVITLMFDDNTGTIL
ncbi:MAG: SusF/SusE family outer membrane protein [Bacteroidales bacterium]|nr:SusF/SusE family outer membrane protein [Bacteroidales bacterium]